MSENAELKTLAFVPAYSAKGVEIASSAYTTAKGYAPPPLQQQITKIEESVTAVSAPYISKAQDKGTELLKVVDSKVDQAVQGAGQVYAANSAYLQSQLEKQKQVHAHNLESFKAAREHYLKQVQDSVEFLRANGLTGAARRAADEVSARVAEARKLPGALLKSVHDAYDRLAALEPVHKALDAARPAVDAAYKRYDALHGSVVASPTYKKAYDLSQAAVARAQGTFVYRRAASSLYPLVARYADPALEQIAASPYYKAAVTHLQPQVVA